jgi:hypothetical protein
MFFDQRNKILRRVTRQSGFTKMRIFGNKIIWRSVEISEITTPAAGNDNFASDFGVMLQQQNLTPAPAGRHSAKQPGRARAYHYRVNFHPTHFATDDKFSEKS